MYNVFFSKIEFSMGKISCRLKEIVKENSKVAVFPWAFPVEITSDEFETDYFPINGRRYNKYLDELKKIGIEEENVVICNPYKHTKDQLKNIIKNSDILLLPGGNPEMFFKKVLHDTEILYDIKHFEGIIIGESAGSELQLERYFITAKNNFYGYFAFYDGFGVIKDPFYMDVHSVESEDYLNQLRKVANEKNKIVYAIYDDGALLYNRNTKQLEQFGHIQVFEPEN